MTMHASLRCTVWRKSWQIQLGRKGQSPPASSCSHQSSLSDLEPTKSKWKRSWRLVYVWLLPLRLSPIFWYGLVGFAGWWRWRCILNIISDRTQVLARWWWQYGQLCMFRLIWDWSAEMIRCHTMHVCRLVSRWWSLESDRSISLGLGLQIVEQINKISRWCLARPSFNTKSDPSWIMISSGSSPLL